jgi:hypothetical protein
MNGMVNAVQLRREKSVDRCGGDVFALWEASLRRAPFLLVVSYARPTVILKVLHRELI